MTENFERLAQLILNNWQGQCTESEKSELQEWLDASERNKKWHSQFEDIEWVGAELEEYSAVNLEESRQKLWSKINANEVEEPEKEIEVESEIQPRRININAAIWLAASIIILIIGAIFILPHSVKQQLTAFVNESDSPKKIASDTNIVLTLYDGVEYILDREKKNETISKDDGVYIVNRKLVFDKAARPNKKEKSPFNKLIIPKGGFYQLELADGSNVWLNSASTISFPAIDTGKTRNINITGEAYLEVKKDNRRPFIVNLPSGISMEVLGTTFNINTYPDEPYIGITLIEGQVNVKKAGKSTIIKKGQQCRIDGMDIQVKDDADVTAIAAWKNGMFSYYNDSLTTVVRDLARWYDLRVHYIDTPHVRVSYLGKRSEPADTTVNGLQGNHSKFSIRLMNDTLVIKK